MKIRNNKPNIRFKGFSYDLKQYALSEVSYVFDGTHQTPNYTKSGVGFVSVENIKDLEPKKYISKEVYDREYAKKPAEKGDVFMTRIGNVGISKVINTEETLAYYVTLALLKPKDIDSHFLNYVIGSSEVQKDIWKRTLHIAFPKKINLDEINQILLMLPKMKEQKKIGDFFKQIDTIISLHQRKLDNLEILKKTLLNKMFPINGEKIPELRFKGSTDAWEQRKLKEFGKSTGGTSIESEFVEGGKYKVISIGSYSEQSVYTDQNIRAELTDITRSRVLNKGDLTMILNDKTASGNIIGRVLLIDSNDSYVYNQRTERIEPDHKKYDSQFLYHMLNAPMIRSKIIKQAQGNTQIYVNWSAIGELDYLVPNLDEQREISAFFFNLNNLITLHQRKIEQLQQMKQYFLKNMFV